MDRLAYLNAKAREKGEDYGTFLGKVNQEARWDSVVVGKELLQKELELVHEIEDKGYKKFKNNFKGNVRSFQKIFDDDNGKRYFINAHLYIHQSKADYELIWEYESCLYKDGSKEPIKMLFYNGWTLEEAEDYMGQLWETELFDYYEVYS